MDREDGVAVAVLIGDVGFLHRLGMIFYGSELLCISS